MKLKYNGFAFLVIYTNNSIINFHLGRKLSFNIFIAELLKYTEECSVKGN